ncbi:MAG: EamA family transporter [Pyrinomonadaceae bacterium]
MRSIYFPFALTVGGMLLYHLSQKSIPKEMNPFFATIIAYAVGIVMCAACALIYTSKKSFVDSVRDSNWAVFALGIGAACIELGFLLVYRAGWRISVAAIATNVAVTAMLIPIGIIVFKDHLSVRNIIGLLFCILGLVLVVRD